VRQSRLRRNLHDGWNHKADLTDREIGLEVAPPGFEPGLPDLERRPRATQTDKLTGSGVPTSIGALSVWAGRPVWATRKD